MDMPPGIGSPMKAGAHIFEAGLTIEASKQLFAALRSNNAIQLDKVIQETLGGLLKQQQWDPRDYADASITEIAAGVVSNQLRGFFNKNHNIYHAAFGSTALLAATASLSDAGLGPYLNNVNRLLRSERDLFGLTLLAGTDESSGRNLQFQRCLVLLSTHLVEGARISLSDALGDRGLGVALAGMLNATWHAVPIQGSRLLWSIRDSALDLGEVDLAAHAQASIVRLSPGKVEEWIVLAEVLGGRDNLAASRALDEALRLSPSHTGALELREAFKAGNFGAFEVLRGMGSPPWRVALRAQHRVLKAPSNKGSASV